LTFCQRNKQNAGRDKGGTSKPVENAPQITASQSNQGAHEPPSPMHWTPSIGPAQPSPPLRINISQHGSTIHQQQGDLAHTEDSHFPGGFVQMDNHLSTSPTALTESSSVNSQPNGLAQRPPPVVTPSVDRDEYAQFPLRHFLLLIYFHMEVLCLVSSCGPRWEWSYICRGTAYAFLLPKIASEFGSISAQALRSLTMVVGPCFVLLTRDIPHLSPISRLVVLDDHSGIPYGHLCTSLSGNSWYDFP